MTGTTGTAGVRQQLAVWAVVGLLVTGLAATGSLLLGRGGPDRTPRWIKDGTADLDLSVTGRPIPESLALVEKVVLRLRRGDADGLAALAASPDGEAGQVAGEWVHGWGRAAAGPATAHFDPGVTDRWTVELRFAGRPEPLPLELRRKGDGDQLGLIMTTG
ncbi:hypothetical protein IHE55_25690 [Streptomyces pactum]|uniref:Uncharacterized protein n=1 Tax=Streptomyces pactum TaxID=68249 RepID=A0ABS0NS13_9ACTN|nr:hypothetical protein [Streptomyces pactum]MBH5337985.1 hypothetical protein [Streptomyces pactum]